MKLHFGFILIISILGSAATFASAESNSSTEPTPMPNIQPQEYMANAEVQFFSETGTLENRLSANRWAYFPDTQQSQLITPHLTVYKPDGTIWTVDAKRGHLQQPTLGTIEKISLYEQVVVVRPATATAIPIKLETDSLDYHPEKQYAEGAQSVTLTKPGLTIIGIGFRAFLDKSHVELLHDVKTHYTSTF